MDNTTHNTDNGPATLSEALGVIRKIDHDAREAMRSAGLSPRAAEAFVEAQKAMIGAQAIASLLFANTTAHGIAADQEVTFEGLSGYHESGLFTALETLLGGISGDLERVQLEAHRLSTQGGNSHA